MRWFGLFLAGLTTVAAAADPLQAPTNVTLRMAGDPSPLGVVSARNGKILDSSGKPVVLTGWRVGVVDSIKNGPISFAEINGYEKQGLLGNAQGIEIWWSRSGTDNPGEEFPQKPGVYSEEGLKNLLETMRNFVRAGSYIIPSIRVSYDETAARENTASGSASWQGWAVHGDLVNNSPVVVTSGTKAGTYGRHRDRFFKWLDWLMPKILADREIADKIAYWEMWHYYGHRHNTSTANQNKYLDEFLPAMISHYRKNDPDHLLGVGFNLDSTVTLLNNRIGAGTWTPYSDPNLIYVVGGYGVLCAIMRPDINCTTTNWPKNSTNPTWVSARNEFNIETLARLAPVTLHSQEGPGLTQKFRENPIPQPARSWFVGLLNLYNEVANGWGIHDWPPSKADEPCGKPDSCKTAQFDETDFNEIVKKSIRGEQVAQ